MSDLDKIHDPAPSRFFVFMGVCGVGKSTVARAVADALSGTFIEGDALHSRENVKAMAEGRPLTDEERWPWLDAVCEAARSAPPSEPVTIACSALKKGYRDFMRAHLPEPIFLHLEGPEDVIRDRMARRQSHFMSPAMLASQLSILEPPSAGPACHILDVRVSQDEVIAQAISICRRHFPAAQPQGAMPGADQEQYQHQRRKH
ncbi:gluconokinase [Chelativorans salis]|uniref:Gluconokinase n=1 Tax=Chelativorans salis TaxID=2978478 RepID=A0ABT2LGW8_9HYPH|nr:gluconokinase [Chelativorans sp. EGI FJ00035]MCT7373775.1 gluconokinase [Chelativorans sp. EGI FJ00035]